MDRRANGSLLTCSITVYEQKLIAHHRICKSTGICHVVDDFSTVSSVRRTESNHGCPLPRIVECLIDILLCYLSNDTLVHSWLTDLAERRVCSEILVVVEDELVEDVVGEIAGQINSSWYAGVAGESPSDVSLINALRAGHIASQCRRSLACR